MKDLLFCPVSHTNIASSDGASAAGTSATCHSSPELPTGEGLPARVLWGQSEQELPEKKAKVPKGAQAEP